MAKFDQGDFDPRSIPHLTRHVVLRATRWGGVAQARPKIGPAPAGSLRDHYRKRFGFAARMASSATFLDYETAYHWSKGSEQVPRDILTAAALGRYWQLILPDGTVAGHVPGPIYTPDPGPEPPPTPPQPWSGPYEMIWPFHDAAWGGTPSGSAYAMKGNQLTPLADLEVTGIAAILTTVSGGTYRAGVGQLDGSGAISTLTQTADWTATSSAKQLLSWSLTATLPGGATSFTAVWRTDAGDTYALPIAWSVDASWIFPAQRAKSLRLARAAPAIGHTPNVITTDQAVPIGLTPA